MYALTFIRPFILTFITAAVLGPPLAEGAITFSTPATAVQQVSLLGINATLTAVGEIQWIFDLDANGNTVVGGTSTLAAQFQGTLPSEFGPLAGIPFSLFSLDNEIVNVTGNGTHISVDTTFGLDVGPGGVIAKFYTPALSNFSALVPGIPFGAGIVFQDPNRPNDITQVFIGGNLLGVPPDTLVGISFDRTVTTTPEPASLLAWSTFALAGLAVRTFRRRRTHA